MTAESEQPSVWTDRTLDPSAVLLTDRVAVVTGAAQGIGQAIALTFARFGADLAICDRNADGLAETAAQIQALGRHVVTGELDVRDEHAVPIWIERVATEYGRIDVLVNNAGGGFWSPFMEVNTKGELALIRENFTSVTLFTRQCVPHMGQGSSIINITSIEAHRAGPGFAVYSAMKAAVANLTKSLSMELGARKIRVNCIAPDVIPTPGDSGLADDSGALGLDSVAISSSPETGSVFDCAGAAVFLAGDLSRFVSGSTVHVDGGNWAAGGWKVNADRAGFTL
ncbi:MAG: SDR family oxidoreductase [Acidimicrobiales bacterium]|nr:SDR family oxidoreductase [Acidimicrobiales bacterium]